MAQNIGMCCIYVTDVHSQVFETVLQSVSSHLPEGRRKMDGWMTCEFTSFSTVFQSYQDDGRMIMKGCVQWNLLYD